MCLFLGRGKSCEKQWKNTFKNLTKKENKREKSFLQLRLVKKLIKESGMRN